jgi:hypothetical protein
MGLEIRIGAHGAVFDGEAELIMDRYRMHIEDYLGDRAVTDIRAYLPLQYMYLGHHGGNPEFNPVPPNAGALARSVVAERQTDNEVLVSGDRVTYGAWIEGDSSLNSVVFPHRRNPPPRRFPGYHTFRIIAQVLNDEAESIAQSQIAPYIMELNT